MSNINKLVTVALVGLPLTAGAHGIEVHVGYGFWHDLMHIAPFIGGGLLMAAMIVAFLRWQDHVTY